MMMQSKSIHFRIIFGLLLLIAPLSFAQDPASNPGSKSVPSKETRNPDSLKIPPGTVIVISDSPKDALQNIDAVVMSPEEYRKLVESAEEAKRPAAGDRPEIPSVCRIQGKVEDVGEQQVVRLKIVYSFRTTRAKTLVTLGLGRSKVVSAKFDNGKLPVLIAGKDEDGLQVSVETAGEYSLTVDCEMLAETRSGRGNDPGFEIGLPGSAITTIERLELPANVTQCRVANKTVAGRNLTQPNSAYVLGPSTKLDVFWEAPSNSGAVNPVITVDGTVDFRWEDRSTLTRSKLSLKVLRGSVGVIQVAAPLNSEFTIEGGDSAARVEKPRNPRNPIWTLRRTASRDDLRLDVATKTEWKAGQPVRIAIPSVIGATQQKGTLSIENVAGYRLKFQPLLPNDIVRKETSDENLRSSVFQYFRLPETGPLLDIETAPVRGEIETRIDHQLTLIESGWRWQGKIDVRPIRSEVERIDIEIPEELKELRSLSPEVVEGIAPLRGGQSGRRLVRLNFAGVRRKGFSLTLEGVFPSSPSTLSVLPLPRILDTIDQGGAISVSALNAGELRATLRDWDRDNVGTLDRPLELTVRGNGTWNGTVDRTPARLELSLRSPRLDGSISAKVDLFLNDRQVNVRHTWNLPAGANGTRKIPIRTAASLAGRVRAVEGCQLSQLTTDESVLLVTAKRFVLEYSVPVLSRVPTSVEVPLIVLDKQSRCETEVRIWNGASVGVARIVGPWTELPPQLVADQPDWPALSVWSATGDTALRLELTASDGGVAPRVERMWVQIGLDSDGAENVRTRAWVRPGRAQPLIVRIPDEVDLSSLQLLVDGKRISRPERNSAGEISLQLPAGSSNEPHLLDITYARRDRTKLGLERREVSWPRMPGIRSAQTRLQLIVPSRSVPLVWGQGIEFHETIRWSKGHPVVHNSQGNTELANWFYSERRKLAEPDSKESGMESSTLFSADSEAKISLLVVPRLLLTLFSSFALLFAALGIGWRLQPRARPVAILVLLLILFLVWDLFPQPVLRIVLAGAFSVVAISFAGILWWLIQRRKQRNAGSQNSFSATIPVNGLSGTSIKSGASLKIPEGEPSTIDAPAFRSQASLPSVVKP